MHFINNIQKNDIDKLSTAKKNMMIISYKSDPWAKVSKEILKHVFGGVFIVIFSWRKLLEK